MIVLGRTAEAGAVLDQAVARGASAEVFPFARYILAVLEGNSTAMQREAESATGKPFEHRMLILRAQTAGFLGQLGNARRIAQNAARRGISSAPVLMSSVALMEAVFGLEQEARSRAQTAIRLDRGRRTAAPCALALALTNEPAAAEAIMSDLLRRYSNDTMLNSAWLPAVRGALALKRGDARWALEATETPPNSARNAWPPYIRGAAYLRLGLPAQAAAEFRRIIGWKPILFASAIQYGASFAYPAARCGLARALAMDGQMEASRRAYEEFLQGWDQADPHIPILVRAKAELAALPQSSASGVARR